MRRWGLILIFALLFLTMASSSGFAQGDPYNPDSLITRSISYLPYRPGYWSVAYIHLDFVTDEDVVYFYIPLRWNSIDGEIYVGYTVWRDLTLLWDEYLDSIAITARTVVLRGTCDLGGGPNPPLNTSGVRRNLIDLRLVITPQASPQEVVMDTVVDRPYNSLQFGLSEGIDFVPAFAKTRFQYGEFVGIEDEFERLIDDEFGLMNFPNPFNDFTTFSFSLDDYADVALKIYDAGGRLVRTLVDRDYDAGHYRIVWNGETDDGLKCGSGVFLCRLAVRGKISYHKVILLR